jgi:hypothetical protein
MHLPGGGGIQGRMSFCPETHEKRGGLLYIEAQPSGRALNDGPVRMHTARTSRTRDATASAFATESGRRSLSR